MLKHKTEIKAWLNVSAGNLYKIYLQAMILNFSDQLVSNYMTPQKDDISMVIRGRIHMLQDLLGLEEALDGYAKIKAQIMELEGEI